MSDPLLLPVSAACLVAFVSALFVVLARGAIRAVVALLAHSLSIAALYALLAAGLVAVGQLLIYSGAIVVLFLFVVALLPPGGRELTSQPVRVAAGVLVGLVLLAVLFIGIQPAFVSGTQLVAAGAQLGDVASVGHELFDFDKLLVPFELTAPLLLVAIVGAVALWRRQEPA
jgi:NADH-quinone oxidoreductase subunit J